MKQIYTYMIAVLTLLAVGCDEYLGIEPKGKLMPTTCDDYEGMLNDMNVFYFAEYEVDLMTDDAFLPENPQGNLWQKQEIQGRKMYTFDNVPYEEGSYERTYTEAYKRLFYFNSVADNIMDATLGTPERKRSLRAEALLQRAVEHFMLVNLYGKQYDASSAATDPGIPLALRANIGVDYERNTVQQVYDQILTDLHEAVKDLPAWATITKYRACLPGGYAMLARTYLQMGNYAKAQEYADSTLKRYNTLADMNQYSVIIPGPFPYVPGAPVGWTSVPHGKDHPESIVHRTFLRPFGIGMDCCASRELSDLFMNDANNDDKRWILYYANNWPPMPPPFQYMTLFNVKIFLRGNDFNNLLSTPEMYLIRAECKARNNDLQGALDDVNWLRKHRITPEAYAERTLADFGNDAEQVLRFVLDERRRELAFTGTRLRDLKRLNKDPRFAKTVTHHVEENNTTYTMEPNSYKYQRQIYPSALKFNPDWPVNPTN